MAIRTELEVDLLECSAPVDGQYPLQFVSIESAGADEKLRFPAGTEGAQREINILLGSNIQAGRLIVGVTRSLPGNWMSWLPHEHAAILEEIYVYVDSRRRLSACSSRIRMRISPAELGWFAKGTRCCCPRATIPMFRFPAHP